MKQGRLLLFVDWFVPGFKAGGQIRSCANLARGIADALPVYVVTSDRDLGDPSAYPGVPVNEWTEIGHNIQVCYRSPDRLDRKSIAAAIRDVRPTAIYLNSMFSWHFTLQVLIEARLRKPNCSIYLAPRGMLQKGALQFKAIKKQLFLQLFRLLRWHRAILFHATDVEEQADIRRVFGHKARVQVIADYPTLQLEAFRPVAKTPGALRLLFLSRIAPKKNLHYLLERLKDIQEIVQLSIVGPVENELYWEKCKALIASLPSNITCTFHGAAAPQDLKEIYRANHLFVLPTHGENFGHVIYDAFIFGRPVLISDRTPWRALAESKVGWDLPLSDTSSFLQAINTACAWEQQAFDEYCHNAVKYIEQYNSSQQLRRQYLEFFSSSTNQPLLRQVDSPA